MNLMMMMIKMMIKMMINAVNTMTTKLFAFVVKKVCTHMLVYAGFEPTTCEVVTLLLTYI